jgi:hypothetical protein
MTRTDPGSGTYPQAANPRPRLCQKPRLGEVGEPAGKFCVPLINPSLLC